MAETFLEVDRVSHTYTDGLPAIENVSLAIPTGAFVVLVGLSGVGKTTLLRIMAGLLPPQTGSVRYHGGQRSSIGIVFQRHNLMPWRTAYDNVRLPLELQGVRQPETDRRVQELFQIVGLNGFERSYPAQLSGGMAQRVALARALVHRPALLLLDEPFGALDALTRERMSAELLRIWQALPVTVFMVTHSIPEAVLLADEVLVMGGRPGAIVQRFPIVLPHPRQLDLDARPEFHAYVTAIRAAIAAHEVNEDAQTSW